MTFAPPAHDGCHESITPLLNARPHQAQRELRPSPDLRNPKQPANETRVAVRTRGTHRFVKCGVEQHDDRNLLTLAAQLLRGFERHEPAERSTAEDDDPPPPPPRTCQTAPPAAKIDSNKSAARGHSAFPHSAMASLPIAPPSRMWKEMSNRDSIVFATSSATPVSSGPIPSPGK